VLAALAALAAGQRFRGEGARELSQMYDIHLRMYKDENCFEEHKQDKFLVGGCYANYYSNVSVAFSFGIVALQEPRRLSIDLYSDHCHTVIAERYIYETQCEPFFGDYHGQFTLVARTSCYGAECATVTTADQSFFEHSTCHGGNTIFEFPVSTMSRDMQKTFGTLSTVGMPGYEETTDAGWGDPGELVVVEEKYRHGQDEIVWPAPVRQPKDYCLRSMNGTKMFQRNPNGTQIHEFVFPLSPDCKPLEYVGYHWYAYTVGHCYMMKTPGFSFKWYTIKGSIVQGVASLAGLLAFLFVLS
jgi:hypothetical protein